MKLKALTAAAALTVLALLASGASFAHSRLQLDASADKALDRFYALNPANKHPRAKPRAY